MRQFCSALLRRQPSLVLPIQHLEEAGEIRMLDSNDNPCLALPFALNAGDNTLKPLDLDMPGSLVTKSGHRLVNACPADGLRILREQTLPPGRCRHPLSAGYFSQSGQSQR